MKNIGAKGISKVVLPFITNTSSKRATFAAVFYTYGENKNNPFFRLSAKYKKIALQHYFALTLNKWFYLDTASESRFFRNAVAKEIGLVNFKNINNEFIYSSAEYFQKFFQWFSEFNFSRYLKYQYSRNSQYVLKVEGESVGFGRITPIISNLSHTRERAQIVGGYFSKENCLLEYAAKTLNDYPKQLKTIRNVQTLTDSVVAGFQEKNGIKKNSKHFVKVVAVQRFIENAQINALNNYGFPWNVEEVYIKSVHGGIKDLTLHARAALGNMREAAKNGKIIAEEGN